MDPWYTQVWLGFCFKLQPSQWKSSSVYAQDLESYSLVCLQGKECNDFWTLDCLIFHVKWLVVDCKSLPIITSSILFRLNSFMTFYTITLLTRLRNPHFLIPCWASSPYPDPYRTRFPWLLTERLYRGHERAHLSPRPRVPKLYMDESTWEAFRFDDCWRLDLSRYEYWKSRRWKQSTFSTV